MCDVSFSQHLFQLLSTEIGTIRNKRRVTLSEHVGSVCMFGKILEVRLRNICCKICLAF